MTPAPPPSPRPSGRKGAIAWIWLGAAAAATAGCAAPYSEQIDPARLHAMTGNYDASIAAMNVVIDVDTRHEMPDAWGSDVALAVLERGSLLQAEGEFEASARDLQAADIELELLDIGSDAGDTIGQYFYSDSAKAYKLMPVERLALNTVNMLNYLAMGDLDGARVEARRFTVNRNYLLSWNPENADAPLGSYLAGFIFEQLGEWDEALRYYDEALGGRRYESLRYPVTELMERAPYRGNHLEAFLARMAEDAPPPDIVQPPEEDSPETEASVDAEESETAESADEADPEAVAEPAAAAVPLEIEPALFERLPRDEEGGTLLVVASLGRVPYKVVERVPIGAAIGIAGSLVTGNLDILTYSAFKVVAYPELVPSGTPTRDIAVAVDDRPIYVELGEDLGSEVRAQYEEVKPRIIAAALSRMLTRAVLAETARQAGMQAGGSGALIGLLAALAVEGTLVGLDKPDTRSWTFLPDRMKLARVELPAGSHRVEVRISGPSSARRAFDVNVPAGGYRVLLVSELR